MNKDIVDKQNKKEKPTFLEELLAICCGVISPKSLNGLNHCNLDNEFHIANQEQNIRDLLERLCYATEFEIEGWKKIMPLTDIIEKYTDVPVSSLKLKMRKNYAVSKPLNRPFNIKDFIGKTIKDSEIYQHFTNEDTRSQKLVIYVSNIIPINQNCLDLIINPDGQHCVVATGIDKWNGVECLILENTGGKEDLNYIPVDFPFFEEVWNITNNHMHNIQSGCTPDKDKRKLNQYGANLAQIKWKQFKTKRNGEDWFNIKNKDGNHEYQMFFVKGVAPIFQLEFDRS